MQTRQLGRSPLQVSSIGLGCVTFGREIDEAAAFTVMDHALGLGINLFDTAEAYGAGASETTVGVGWPRAARATASCSAPRSAATSPPNAS